MANECLQGCATITPQDLDRIFETYDKVRWLFERRVSISVMQDGNEIIEEDELDAFVKDLMDLIKRVGLHVLQEDEFQWPF